MPTKNKPSSKAKKSIIHEGFRDPVQTAVYYGFVPLKHTTITDEDRKTATHIDSKESHEADPDLVHIDLDTKEKISLIRSALENGAQSGQPSMTYFEKKVRNDLYCHLDIIGNSNGVAEGITIAAAVAILKDAGMEDINVYINCVGDRDSSQRFTKALSEYYKKNASLLPATCKAQLKKDIFALLTCDHEKCKALCESAPKSMNFLSEQSRDHFKEVLEYLSASDITFVLADNLLPTKGYTTQTIFYIEATQGKKKGIFAFGARYNGLSKRMGGKREVGAVGITLCLDEKLFTAKTKHTIPNPEFFLIHVGTEARYRSLAIVEFLRQGKIPLAQSIIKDKLSNQLMQAELLGTPFTLLMGQKECVDKSIIVRDNSNRSQNSVKLDDLLSYIKKIR